MKKINYKGRYPHQKIYNYHKPVPKKDWPKRETPEFYSGVDIPKVELDFDSWPCCGGKGRKWVRVSARKQRMVVCSCEHGEKQRTG